METSKRDALALITDEAIANVDTETLRELAEQLMEDYNYRETVARVTMTDTLSTFGGGLSAVDTMMVTLMNVYRKRGARRVIQYNELQITVWADDDTIRRSLKYAAKRARTEQDEEAAKETERAL